MDKFDIYGLCASSWLVSIEQEKNIEFTKLGVAACRAPPLQVFICPITHAMFRDPVFVPESGNTYERSASRRFHDDGV